jgi:hypothetical protein
MAISDVPNLLSSVGLVSYNGIVLTGSELTTSIEMACRYDSSGRSLELVDITFHFRKIFRNVNVNDALNKLTQPGGILVFTGLGWKDLVINDPGNRAGQRDAEYGPKTMGLKWRPLGGSNYWELQNLTIKTCIPFCFDGAPLYRNAIQSYCFTVDFDIDEEGITTRNISGHLTIPATRASVGSRILLDHADNYRDLIAPVVPNGFRLTKQKYGLSEDKRTLNFNLIHSEINSDMPYPEGIVDIDVDETMSNMDKSFCRWEYNLSGTLTVARPWPKSLAWEKFAVILKKRLQFQTGQSRQRRLGPGAEANFGGVPLLSKLVFEDAMFGRRSHFSISWMLLTTLAGVLADSGMWSPVNANDWNQWRTSMSAIWDQRGTAQLGFAASNDLIIDLCEQGSSDLGTTDNARTTLLANPSSADQGKPNPQESWVEYNCFCTYLRDGAVIRHKPLPMTRTYSTNVTEQPTSTNTTKSPNWGSTSDQPGGNFDATQPDIVQKLSNPTYTVKITGSAVRVGYPIQEPKLTSIDGVTSSPVENKSNFRCGVVGSAGNWPIYAATWDTEYIIPQAATTVPVPYSQGL